MSDRRSDTVRILFDPQALDCLSAGFDHLAALLAVTLGPSPGPILNARSRGSVELLSDAGTVARRVVAVPDRGRNSGAMIARHLAWRMHEQFGDGAATAAVLSRAMVHEAVARIAAGIDRQVIRRGLELALPTALAALAAESTPVHGQADLKAVATGITGDPELGMVLGEIVDLLGADAALTIEEFPAPLLDREYVEGASWRAHPATRSMIPEGRREIVLENPLLMLVDQPLTHFDDVQAALELAMGPAGRRPLLIVPAKIGDQALATISTNSARGSVTAIASILSAVGPALTDELGDLATLTGGDLLADALGRPPAWLRLEDLGAARKAVVTRESMTIVGGAGSPAAVAERASALRRRMERLSATADERTRLQGRLARLSGGSAILKMGAHSTTELADKRAQAEKAFRVLTGLLSDGVVSGGGVAFLACAPAVRAMRESIAVPGQEHGFDVLLTALEAPFVQIIRNQGRLHPPLALAQARRLGCGYGVDVISGDFINMRERGIIDSLRVAQGALQLATSAAISVFTTAVVVLPPAAKRERRTQP